MQPNENKICVKIGKNVSIAPNVTFICSESPNNGKEICKYLYIKNKASKEGNIIVEDEVWIGTGVTIFSGITVGKCAVLGAGALVTHDIEPYGVYIGSPARKIRDIRE